MLQRVQTIWLFLATVCIFSLFFFPYLQVMDTGGSVKVLYVTGVYENISGQMVQTHPFLGITIGTVILGLIPFVIIFYYKNRKKQITSCYIAILAILAYSIWLIQNAKQVIGNITLTSENYGIGVLLPSIATLFLILALRGIRTDEKLIKSADRLR